MNASLDALMNNKRWTFREIDEWNRRLDGADAPLILRTAIDELGARLVLASSFGAEDVVLIDLAVRVDPGVRIFTLDTGRLPEPTYDVMERIRAKYGVRFETVLPDPAALTALLDASGPLSFYRSVEDRRECCRIRKVEPLARVLANADAWATGLRRAQSVTRAELAVAELDLANGGKLKLNPLAAWSEDDVWNYIRKHDVPFNSLHEMGYPSIGCAPCTRAVRPGEDLRAGRWWWERPDDKECGLHRHDA